MTDTTAGEVHTTLRSANAARQNEWDKDARITLSYRLNELAGETGEACNVGKKIERERLGIRGSRDTIEHLAEELADVVICADLVALAEGIDLDAAVIAKFNATSEKIGLATRLAAQPSAGAQGEAVAWRVRTTNEHFGSFIVTDPKTHQNGRDGWISNGWIIEALGVIATPAQPDTGDVTALLEADRKWLTGWLSREKDGGHCGEGVFERRERADWNDRIDRILAALSKPNAPGREG